MWSRFKLSNKDCYSTLRTHQKNMHTSVPSLVDAISMTKCFDPKPLLWGAPILTRPQKKACQTMCIINHILSHKQGCANWCLETSSALSVDNWVNAVCHCQFHSHTLTLISTTLKCISLNQVSPFITTYLTSSIHFSPILKENFYQLFAPFSCWYIQRSGAILGCPTWSANASTQNKIVRKQMLHNIHFLPFFFKFKKAQTQQWLCQSITHLLACPKKHALSTGRTNWPTNAPKDDNGLTCLPKTMLWTKFSAFQRISNVVQIQTQQ